MYKLKLILLFILLSPCFNSLAQTAHTITGTITEATGETLPGATVFLADTKYFTATGNDGKFTFNDIPAGSYQLIIKMMGFAPYVNKITVGANTPPISVVLKDDSKLLKTVTISATDPNRKKYLAQFTKYFIGESINASRCKILNPQVLAFHYDRNTGVLQAHADSILRIENNGLGYILNYVLTEFKVDPKNNFFSYTGYPFFEELKGSESQHKRWYNRRKEAYLGSANHFFRSVYNGTTGQSGFIIYAHSTQNTGVTTLTRITADQAFSSTDGRYKVLNARYGRNTDSNLYIVYNDSRESKEFTTTTLDLYPTVDQVPEGQLSGLLPLADNILIDTTGTPAPTKSFLFTGYWGWQKVAEALPLGYHVDVKVSPSITTEKPQTINLTEKTYLHLDKNFYMAGDTVWFKAYLVAGVKHQPSAISNVLNVELIDFQDSVIQRLRLLVENGLSKGDFKLPFNIETGTYHLRAYTNWMRNAGEEYFYDQAIAVINPNSPSDVLTKTTGKANGAKAVVTPKLKPPAVDIQFFPEGGTFAVNVPEKIAFKATGSGGKGINIAGTITDEQENEVATFSSSHLGMGVFSISVEQGKTYKAKIKLPDSSVQILPLPKAVNHGFVLSVTPAGQDNIRVAAQAINDKDAAQQTGEMTLIGRCGGVVYYEGKSKAGSNSFTVTIPKNKFPTGIVQFTLYSSSGEPLNERLLFVQNNDQLKIDVSTEKQTYAPQQKVKLNLTAKTNDGQPVRGSFSVSVIDETKVPNNDIDDNNILSNLLLTSDLKGYIENPAYYFASADQKTADDLDALMLTQGYRSFEWKKAANTTFEPETGLTVSGYLKTNNGKPVPNGKVQLFATGGTFLAQDTTADSKGHFVFKNMFFNDSAKFMLQGTTEKERYNLQISLDKPNRPTTAKNKYRADLLINDNNDNTKQLASFIETSKVKYEAQVKYNITDKNKLLKEVIINDHTKPVLKYSDNLNGPGNADYIFTAKDIASFKCGFITTCLEGRVPGLGLSSNGANSFLYLTKIGKSPMLVLINGSPGDMNSLTPNSIESIEVLTNMGHTAIYGSKGNAGVILITTKRGADEVDLTMPSPGTITFSANGFEKAREFYSPQYDNPKTNKEIADLRTTIYWNPMLQTDKDGNASFEYFNAGSKGNYKVVVEGIDNDGNIGRFVYRYKVE